MIPTPLHAEAMELARRGDWAKAEAAWRRIVTAAPADGEAWFHLGVALQQSGRNDDAVAAYGRVIAVDPDHVLGLIGRARLLRAMGRAADGLKDGARAASLAPDEPVAQYVHGVLLLDCAEPEKALAALDLAVALNPQFPLAHFTRALALRALHRDTEALQAVEITLSLEDMPVAHSLAGEILFAAGRVEDSIVAFDRALKGDPDLVAALLGRSTSLRCLRRSPEAKVDLDRVLSLQPNFAFGHYCHGWNAYALGDLDTALADFAEARRLDPELAQAWLMLVDLKSHRCQWDDDREGLRAAVWKGLEARLYFDPFVMLGLYDDPALHKQAAMCAAAPGRPPLHRRRSPQRPRIALLSSDFRNHAVGWQIAELTGHFDYGRFEIVGVCAQRGRGEPDPVRNRLKAQLAAFVETVGLSDLDIAARLAAAGTAIAVDLGVYTESARPEILSHRPAAVTAQWLGYPGTSGAASVDYVIADRVVVPQGAEEFYTEKIVRLPGSYMPLDTTIAPGPTPPRASLGLPDDAVVLSAFNRASKISPAMFARWLRLLAEVPGSVLWLSAGKEAQPNLRQAAAAASIDPARLIFAERSGDRAAYLGRLTAADLYLDSFPYGGHATASDHLLAGVPVVTAPGHSFASRVAASMLTAAGLPELIAADEAAYHALAAGLARNPVARNALRSRLIAARHTAPLFDMKGMARNLEDAFLRMWEGRNEPPKHIDLSAAAGRAGSGGG
jgi:protein O-GlcNAc transferase